MAECLVKGCFFFFADFDYLKPIFKTVPCNKQYLMLFCIHQVFLYYSTIQWTVLNNTKDRVTLF